MSILAMKMTLIRSLRASWAPNYADAQRELFHYAALAIAGNYA